MLYGCNPAWSQHSSMYWLKNAQKAGVKFVFVGPDYNATAAAMDARWIRVRPGTDAALALGMLNVIINEDLYDHDFVDRWCYGFEELAERARDYPLDEVAEITEIPAEEIVPENFNSAEGIWRLLERMKEEA